MKKKLTQPTKKEVFEQNLLKLLKDYKIIPDEQIAYLKLVISPSKIDIKYVIDNEYGVCSLSNKIDFEKSIIKMFKKFKIIGNGLGIQKIDIELGAGDYPTIKIETNYFGKEMYV